jgi:hypothetical protein
VTNKRELTRPNYAAIREHLFDRIHKTGEEVKNDLPNTLRTAIKTRAWTQFTRANGEPFRNLVDWLETPFPNGIGMGQGIHVINYEELLKLTECAPDVHEVLLGNAPKREPGRPKTENGLSTSHFINRRNNRSGSSTVLSVRLAQEYPKYYEAYLRGDYKSITAAAIAAGLLKNNVNLRRFKSDLSKLTASESKEAFEWFKQNRKKLRKQWNQWQIVIREELKMPEPRLHRSQDAAQ